MSSFAYSITQHFGIFVAANDSIEILNLSWNQIRRRGAIAIAAGLKVCRLLHRDKLLVKKKLTMLNDRLRFPTLPRRGPGGERFLPAFPLNRGANCNKTTQEFRINVTSVRSALKRTQKHRSFTINDINRINISN